MTNIEEMVDKTHEISQLRFGNYEKESDGLPSIEDYS
jgi:hypothetical protein